VSELYLKSLYLYLRCILFSLNSWWIIDVLQRPQLIF